MVGGQRGQTTAEYLGGLLVVSAVIAAVATTGVPGRIARGIERQICAIAKGGDPCASAETVGSQQAPGRRPVRAVPSTPAFAAAHDPRRTLSRMRSGTLPGRRIDTSNYQRDIYERIYDGKKPLKYQFDIPNIQGRRGGKLRVSMFIAECEPLKFGEGDCRGFDERFHAAKTRVTFVFDFKSDVLTVLINPSCSREPLRGGCSDPLTPDLGPEDKGTVGGQFGSGQLNVFAGSSGTGDRADVGVGYALKNSRAIPKTASPAIDGLLTLNGYRDERGKRRIKLDWHNDAYPSLEAYYEPPGRNQAPRVVCQSEEESIDDLAGATSSRCDTSF